MGVSNTKSFRLGEKTLVRWMEVRPATLLGLGLLSAALATAALGQEARDGGGSGSTVARGDDETPPTVQLDLVGGAQTIADEVSVLTRFDERLSAPLEPGDVVLTGLPATLTILDISTPGENESEYDVRLVPNDPDADGDLQMQIPPGAVSDLAGNPFGGSLPILVQFNHHAIVVGAAEGNCGGAVTVPIEIMNAESVDDFVFSLDFDPDCIVSARVEAGAGIPQDWIFDTDEQEPGIILVAGLDPGPDSISGDFEIARLVLEFDPNIVECSTTVVPINVGSDLEGYTRINGSAGCVNGPFPFVSIPIEGVVGFIDVSQATAESRLPDGTKRVGFAAQDKKTGDVLDVDFSGLTVNAGQTIGGIAVLQAGTARGGSVEVPVIGRLSLKETLLLQGQTTTGTHAAKVSLSGKTASKAGVSLKGSASGEGSAATAFRGPRFEGALRASDGTAKGTSTVRFYGWPVGMAHFVHPADGPAPNASPASSWSGEAALVTPFEDEPVGDGLLLAKTKWAASGKPGKVTMKATAGGATGTLAGTTDTTAAEASAVGFDFDDIEIDATTITLKAPGVSWKMTIKN